MLEQQSNIVKQQIMKQYKQLQSKQSMIQYYMSYDYPEKQKQMKRFWQDLIQNIIKKKNQIYITFLDLQSIVTINGMKPLPLKNILKQLKKQFILFKQEDLTEQKKPKKKVNSWFNNIISFAWSKKQDQAENPFLFQANQNIISKRFNERKKQQLLNDLQTHFSVQNAKFLRVYIKEVSWRIKINQRSVLILLKQLRLARQVFLGEPNEFEDQVIIYNHDRKKMLDQNFIKVQKIKIILKANHHKFQNLYDKATDKISNLKCKAKEALKNQDKIKARVLLTQVRKQQKYRENIDLRRQLLDKNIMQIQMNELNKSSIDLLQDAQKVYEQVAVDPQKMDEVIARDRQIQMESGQANQKFAQLSNSEQIQNQVDDLLKEIENQISIPQNKKFVQPKLVNVEIKKNMEQDIQIDNQFQLN